MSIAKYRGLAMAAGAARVPGGCAEPATRPVTIDDSLVEREARTPREIALRAEIRDWARLMAVAFPLQRPTTAFCEDDARPVPGLLCLNRDALPEEFQDAAPAASGLGDAPHVMPDVAGARAGPAGLKPGDTLLSVDAEQIPRGQDAFGQTSKPVRGRLSPKRSAVFGIECDGALGEGAAETYNRSFGGEVDYVGLYILARRGAGIRDAPQFLRRMAALHPETIENGHSSTHPASSWRFVAMERTITEIDTKRERGLPLTPLVQKQRRR